MSELELLRKQVHELQLAVRALEDGLKEQLQVRLAELEEASAKIDVLTAQATTSQAKSNEDLARLAQLQEELASRDAALASRQGEIKRLASDSERLAEENRIMREELAKEPTDSGTTELLAELAELRNATNDSEATLASAREEIKRLANDNKRLDEENGKLREQLTNARTQPPQAEPSEGPYPVTFAAVSPGEFGRGHALIRLLLIALWLDLILLLLYPSPPIVAAIMILRKNGRRFVDEDAPRIASALRHVIAMEAYLHLLTDRVGISARSKDVQFAVRPSGTPSVSFALMRLIYSLPSALVVLLLWYAIVVTSFVAAVWVLVQGRYPASLYGFHRAYVRWVARLSAYHFSLVEEYPPFAFDTQQEPAGLTGQRAT